MNEVVWRIAADTPDYLADDLFGAGAEITGGRWNEPGVPMVYASASRALSCLETIVHLGAGGLPLNRYLVRITLPARIWNARETFASPRHVGWDATPPGAVSIAYGTNWVNGWRTAVLVVPSVMVPEESNILINPRHRDSGHITAEKQRRWLFDPRIGGRP